MSAVQPQYGPTLLQLLAVRPRRQQVAAGAFALLLLFAAIVIALRSRPSERVVLLHKPLTFNFVYDRPLVRVKRPGTLVALREMKGDQFRESYLIRDLRLPAYKGAVGGMLPLYAHDYMRTVRRRYPGAQLVNEGRTRLNNGVGYQVTFRGQRDGRTLYIRHFLVVPEVPDGQRHGVLIELESTFAAGTPNAESTGAVGPLRKALRSFRFGEDRTGGKTV